MYIDICFENRFIQLLQEDAIIKVPDYISDTLAKEYVIHDIYNRYKFNFEHVHKNHYYVTKIKDIYFHLEGLPRIDYCILWCDYMYRTSLSYKMNFKLFRLG